MTEKLYWKHPYDKQFEAEIIKIVKDGIILNKTLFYPSSGNQATDTGKIIFKNESYDVKKVNIEEKDIIHEIAPEELRKFRIGDKIKGIINWENRYDLMKAHTSQHILSALIKNKYQINTSRASIEREEVTIQLDNAIEYSQLKDVLIEFLHLCTLKNVEIKTKIYIGAEAKNLEDKLRGQIPNEDPIRIVEIENFDFNCCGGTHVKNSTEIGPTLMIQFKKNRDIKYILGNKAIQRISQLNIEILKISDMLNTTFENYTKDVEKVIESNLNLQTNQESLLSELFKQKILNPDLEFNHIKLYLINIEIEYKFLKRVLDQLPENSVLLIMSETNRIRIISNTDKIKSNEIVENLIENYQGKGGGNPRNAQCLLEREPKDIIRDIQSFIKK